MLYSTKKEKKITAAYNLLIPLTLSTKSFKFQNPPNRYAKHSMVKKVISKWLVKTKHYLLTE